MTKQTKMQDIKPDTERKYSLRELLKEKVNGERVLFIYLQYSGYLRSNK